MIDLRCHILDGTSCGPQSYAESLEMCRVAVDCGVQTIVATPLWATGNFEPPLPFNEIKGKIERLQKALLGKLSIESGFVLAFDKRLPELADRYGTELALGGKKHLLVSLPSTKVPLETEEVWAELIKRGYLLLLAHPECNTALRRTPSILHRWYASGMKFQIDAASLSGLYGREVRKFAIDCLHKYETQVVVASNSRSTNENPLKAARAEIISQLGERRAIMCIDETPTTVISGIDPSLNTKDKAPGKIASLFRSIKKSGFLFNES